MLIKKNKQHIHNVFDTSDETGINWKVHIYGNHPEFDTERGRNGYL